MPESYYALITPLGAGGRPDNTLPGGGLHPDNTLPGGGLRPDNTLPGGGLRPDQGLPGSPGRPGHLPARPGGGLHPDNTLPGGGLRPDNTLPPWQGAPPSVWPPSPVDPDWGIPAGESPQHPIYIPVGPDNSLPPGVDNALPEVPGHAPPADAPPGTVYPPIAGAPAGKAWMKTEEIPGVGHRYVMAEFPASGVPDQGLPPGVDNTLPAQPPTAGQLPTQPTPPAPGQQPSSMRSR
jgi:hypothetical protein